MEDRLRREGDAVIEEDKRYWRRDSEGKMDIRRGGRVVDGEVRRDGKAEWDEKLGEREEKGRLGEGRKKRKVRRENGCGWGCVHASSKRKRGRVEPERDSLHPQRAARRAKLAAHGTWIDPAVGTLSPQVV